MFAYYRSLQPIFWWNNDQIVQIVIDKRGGLNHNIYNNTRHASPLDAHLGGFFMSDTSRFYQKPPLNIDQQLEALIHRGLVVENPDRVRHYLRFIGYYRLSGYFRSFQIPGHPDHFFKKHTTFDSVLQLYIFDRKLRLLVMDAVERIEVAVRATISNTMSEQYGAHWYLKSELFKTNFNHDDLLKKSQTWNRL